MISKCGIHFTEFIIECDQIPTFFYLRAILDGVDLDIENGDYKHYDIFVKELRRLEKNNEIIIGAAPQCPYPDR